MHTEKKGKTAVSARRPAPPAWETPGPVPCQRGQEEEKQRSRRKVTPWRQGGRALGKGHETSYGSAASTGHGPHRFN